MGQDAGFYVQGLDYSRKLLVVITGNYVVEKVVQADGKLMVYFLYWQIYNNYYYIA